MYHIHSRHYILSFQDHQLVGSYLVRAGASGWAAGGPQGGDNTFAMFGSSNNDSDANTFWGEMDRRERDSSDDSDSFVDMTVLINMLR